MIRPTDSPVITNPYGSLVPSPPYSKSNPHAGVDYRAGVGANIYAPHSGTIVISGNLGICGLAIEIDGGRFKSRLCHNSKLLKLVGNKVNEGDVVALAGQTGGAQGPHCHWILWDNAVRVDGSKYVSDIIDDMLSTDSRYKYWRMARLEDPNPDEVKSWEKMDDETFTNHLWNNGGKDYKSKREALRINDIRAKKFKELGDVFGLNPDKDGLDAIISRAKSGGVTSQLLKPGIYEVKS